MQRLRRTTQILGTLLGNGYFAVLLSGVIYKGPMKGVCVPFLNCYACPMAVFSCPIGTLQHFMTIRAIPFMLLGSLGMTGAFVGRMVCGWLCPFGLIQDLMYKVPSKKVTIPTGLANVKYAILIILVIIIPFATGVPWFSKLCPMGTLSAGIPWVLINPRNAETGITAIAPGDVGALFAMKLAILFGFLVLFVKTKRPFCRTTCPLGAIYSVFNRFSVVQMKVAGSCKDCGLCRQNCPVDIQISENPTSGECVRCLNCTSCKNVTVEFNGILAGLRPNLKDTRETL